MKVFAVNSSARVGGQSKTELVLNYLIEGMKAEGAEVEVVNIFEKKINYCIGCFTCWTKTPGKCIYQDDMSKELFPKLMASDLAILAFPLFHYTVNASMKTFIERTLPHVQPFFELRDGVTRHPLRHKLPSIVTVSVAGLPEYEVFEQLTAYINYLYRDPFLKAEIYVPGAESLARKTFHPKIKAVLDALVQAGREIIKDDGVSKETMSIIRTPTSNFEMLSTFGNDYWHTCIEESVTPKEFDQKEMMPRPRSIESFLATMREGYNPLKTPNFKGSYQFDFSGDQKGSCYYAIENGIFKSGIGDAPKANITIKAPFELWMDILTKKADGQQMFLDQQYFVEGDVNLLIRMGDVFGELSPDQ